MVMTSQQVGASLGTALLSTIASKAAASYLTSHDAAPVVGVVPGFNVASWSAMGFVVSAAVLVTLVLPVRNSSRALASVSSPATTENRIK